MIYIPQQIERIDSEAYERITAGFVYNGLTFSLSPTAQLKMLSMRNKLADLTYPVGFSTIDNLAVYDIIDEQSLIAFTDAGFAAFQLEYDKAMLAKKAVLYESNSEEEATAIVDAYLENP